jgi:phenylacetate-CoA ligase
VLDLKTLVLKSKIRVYSPRAIQQYRQLMINQYLSDDELYQLNWEKRKKILLHAYDTVPYYQDKYSSVGIRREDILSITPEEFRQLPLLTRSDLKTNFEKLISNSVGKRHLRLVTTGGSTGQPVKVFHDKRFYGEVHVWRMLNWWGLTPGVNQSTIWRDTRKSFISKLINKFIWWPTRRIHLDASSITNNEADLFLRKFNRLRPPLLKGYVGAIDYLAGLMLERGIQLFPPKAVWVTAAPLSRVQRKRIEEAFQAPVYDQYACSEIFWVAAQCNIRQGLHIFSDSRYVEFLDQIGMPGSDGETGRIVVTDLENYAFPLIRYENGDLGKALTGKCTCGVNLPLMNPVKGRTSDNVCFPDGTFISGEYLTTIFDDFPDAVNAFQVHQGEDYSLTLKIVPNPEYHKSSEVTRQVQEILSQRARGQVPVYLRIVDRIPNDRGKTKFVISEIT